MTDANTGDRNTGDRNTGNWNTGYRNTGDRNTGYRNTGDRNTGSQNTGNWNTGDRNTGNWNTGNWNTGSQNTGNWNTGYRNTGDRNTGDRHTGCFNTVSAQKAYYFNTLLDVSDWDNAYKPDWLYYPEYCEWVDASDMTDGEKAAHPEHATTGGYLRASDIKAEWLRAYQSASPEDVQAVIDLPGFDYAVFEEITGLDLRKYRQKPAPCEGREIEIDGVTYVLKAKGETND
jgi:hypothetical protein